MAETIEETVYDENHPLIRILNDGSPAAYQELAGIYDKEVTAANIRGPHSIAQEWSLYHDQCQNDPSNVQKVLDAGCGTGLVGEEIRRLPCVALVQLYGADLSLDMLDQVKAKGNIYNDLRVVNLKQPLPYEAEFFDSIVCCGTFLQNHCGPECLPNMSRVLKVNGYIVASVRIPYYEETKLEWERVSKECSLELVKLAEIPYIDTGKAYVMVYRKDTSANY